MDPEEALALLREWAGKGDEDGDGREWLEAGPEVFRALDGWLSQGGFLPADWARGRS